MEAVLFILESNKSAFAYAAFLLGALAAPFYHHALITGHRPPYSTYIGWLLLGVSGFWFHWQTILPDDPKWSAFGPLVFIVVPLSYLILLYCLGAKWELDGRDKRCLSGVAVCWAVWIIGELTISTESWFILLPMGFLIVTDVLASWPILQDAYRGEEGKWQMKCSWGLTALSAMCGALAVEKPFSKEMVYPSYLLIMMVIIASCSLFSFLWKKSQSTGDAHQAPAE